MTWKKISKKKSAKKYQPIRTIYTYGAVEHEVVISQAAADLHQDWWVMSTPLSRLSLSSWLLRRYSFVDFDSRYFYKGTNFCYIRICISISISFSCQWCVLALDGAVRVHHACLFFFLFFFFSFVCLLLTAVALLHSLKKTSAPPSLFVSLSSWVARPRQDDFSLFPFWLRRFCVISPAAGRDERITNDGKK